MVPVRCSVVAEAWCQGPDWIMVLLLMRPRNALYAAEIAPT